VSAVLAVFDLVGAATVAVWGTVVGVAETAAPLRRRTSPRRPRWSTNAKAAAVGGLLVRLAVVPAMLAVASRFRGRGLLAALPRPTRFVAGLVLMDGALWLWHRANHAVPSLWRFHAYHHLDPDLDVTTALRFHPIELLLSIAARAIPIAVLGASPQMVVTYEIVLQCATLFHHGNVRLPACLDGALAHAVVTPRMHGIHHSREADHTNSNWGVVLSLWDRVAGTQRLDVPQESIVIGIASSERA